MSVKLLVTNNAATTTSTTQHFWYLTIFTDILQTVYINLTDITVIKHNLTQIPIIFYYFFAKNNRYLHGF